jgi:hypothetical protein
VASITGRLGRAPGGGGVVPARFRSSLRRPTIGGRAGAWRVAAILAAAALCGLLAVAAPGSIQVLRHPPASGSSSDTQTLAWSRACYRHAPSLDHPRLAFCARFDGRVLYSDVGPREVHLLAVGSFHAVIVELPAGSRVPGWGSRIVAVGPLLRARNGQRELQALWIHTS